MILFFLFLLFGLSKPDPDIYFINLYCESFKGNSIYDRFELGSGGCDLSVIPKDDRICLANPLNPEQELDYTCKSLEEIYASSILKSTSQAPDISTRYQSLMVDPPTVTMAVASPTPFSHEMTTLHAIWNLPEPVQAKGSMPFVSVPQSMSMANLGLQQLVQTTSVRPLPALESQLVIPAVQPTSTFSDTKISKEECLKKCNMVLSNVQHANGREKSLLSYQIHYVSQLLYKSEANLVECRNTATESDQSRWTTDGYFDIAKFMYDQRYGLTFGTLSTIISAFFDQRYASHCAKKHGIKQKAVMKFAFSTLICFIQILLRKRNKNSKMAQFLSALKKQPVDQTPNSTFLDQINASNSQKRDKRKSKPISKSHPNRRFSDSVHYRVRRHSKRSIASNDVEYCSVRQPPTSSLIAIDMTYANDNVRIGQQTNMPLGQGV